MSELTIGDTVFHRAKSFNPQEDNIVRSTARSLRQKLREYFESEGKDDLFRIEIPKGSYVPVFPAREEPKTVTVLASGMQRRMMAAAVVLLLFCGAAVVWLMVENRSLASRLSPGSSERNLLSALLEPNEHLHLVLSDGLYCDLTIAQGSLSALEDYASLKPFESETSPLPERISEDLWQLIRRGQYTNVAEAKAATKVALALANSIHIKQHHARGVTMNQLQMGDNFVFLGGRRANPWAGLYEPDLNFQMEFPPNQEAAIFLNRNPRPGEKQIYANSLDSRDTGVTYARIALTPGLSGSGKVVLAAGNSGPATATAAELLLQPRMLSEVEALLGRKVDSNLKRLEMIVERDVVGGNTRDFRIVALR